MFDFGNANNAQIEAIKSTDGPVLITAGPGTGKTFTLVQRAIYLIQEKGVKPEEILVATFTEKAAKELITRITNELSKRGIMANINEMYIGTFHSLCLRIIKEYLEYTRLKKGFRILDAFDQRYTVFQNMNRFTEIEDFYKITSNTSRWAQAGDVCEIVNKLSEELVDPESLITDSDSRIVALGKILKEYQLLISENNLVDFSAIQTEAYWLLSNHSEALSKFQQKVRYIMIDEYQDTNYIQEQLVFLIGGFHKKICVVGDDDQGLYRFRGATIRNILEFPSKFNYGECKIIPLDINYRSNSDIVDFYNKWMATTEGPGFRFKWDGFRYNKTIKPYKKSELHSPAVIKIESSNNEEYWQEKIYGFIQNLKISGKLSDYNQIAFLFNSVRNPRVTNLAAFLEGKGVNVYSPRSNMFFERDEIHLLIGCLMLLFPKYIESLLNKEYDFLKDEHYSYYRNCVAIAMDYLSKPEAEDLRKWIDRKGKFHLELQSPTDYAYAGLLYQMFEYSPFADILSTDMMSGVVDLRPVRNISLFMKIITKYEYLHRIDILSPSVHFGKRLIDYNTETLFNTYLRLLYDDGIPEYEDDSQYAPSGCVSFLTIHQSKGMEFPIVVVDSLWNTPRKRSTDLMETVEEKYYHRPAFEPSEITKFFDFWRLYYTAFSRAQDLLVLTCNINKMAPSAYFREVFSGLKRFESDRFNLSEFTFKPIKDVDLKESFSFTSHISVYETCAKQYKLYKELGFTPVREGGMLFGMLVHQTIEDMHKAALRHEEHLITEENVTRWFDTNYTSLSKSERAYLAEPQKNEALRQVLRYADKHSGAWAVIKEAEVDVSLVKPDYIIKGVIDLIKGEGDTVELVDFKTERKPDLFYEKERIEKTKRQLQVYAHLVEEQTGHKVSNMNIYYTGEENGSPTISFPYQQDEVASTVQGFDDVVHKILRKEFTDTSKSSKVCAECDFRYYCHK